MKKSIIALAILIFLSSGYYLVNNSHIFRQDKDVILIGSVLAVTGESSFWGKNAKDGMELAIEEINKTGGILGKKVRVIYGDSKSNPKDAVAAINKLILVNGVECIIGDVMSSNTLAMAPICERNKKILLNFCVASEITHAGDYIFRNWNSALFDAEFTSNFAKANSKRIIILYQNDSYGVSLKDEFIKRVKDRSRIVFDNAFNRGTKDFRSLISKFSVLDYDGLYIASYYEEALNFLKQYKELNGKDVNIYGVSEWEESTLADFISRNYPNLIYYGYPKPPDSAMPVRKRFLKSFYTKYNRDPEILNDNGYDAVYQIKYGIEKAGINNSTKIKDALYTMKNFKGASGIMSFDENGDVHKPFGLRTVTENGIVWHEMK